VKSREDGWAVTGVPTRLRGGVVEARGDHRIAMLGAVVGLASAQGVEIEDAETVAISFPGFYEVLDSLVKR
jgi:3-phosphoshikimate 1-carboxyvinyltransferase